MRKGLLLAALLLACLSTYFFRSFLEEKKDIMSLQTTEPPRPQEGEENQKLRELYEELRHRAAPNTSWRSIEAANAQATRNRLRLTGARTMESFANGALSGVWSERGASNQAGSIRAVDYVAATNSVYTISNGGSLWSSVLGSGNWTVLNQSFRFNQRSISAFTKTGGGVRILVSAGEQVMYSDDEGASFTPSTGISFPVPWGGNYVAQFIRLKDGSNTLYCLTRPWSDVGWTPRFWLYKSTDQGASFTRIHTFAAGDDDRISLCNPHNTNDLYAVDIFSSLGSVKLYNVSGSAVSLLSTFALGTGNEPCLLKGTKTGGVTTLYLLTNNKSIYRSTNLGTTWSLRSHLTEDAWMKMSVSMSDPEKVSYGGVDAFRSIDGGTSFTRVNSWVEYYGNVPGKLHADIMEIEYFRKADNTEFAIVNTHGGTYLSYDHLLTVSNQSLFSHYATEYYDVLTDTFSLNRIFVGTQDQGIQRTLTGTNSGVQPFRQLMSGDFGQMALTDSGRILWPQYPGGVFYFHKNLDAPVPSYIGSWSMKGTQKPNYGWMLPVATTETASANEIWIGGGNITGGDGSYLIKLAMQKEPPHSITPTQLSYNFRENSNNGKAGITAIEQSLINPAKLFVGSEDGSFFYSVNGGATWSKTTSFDGPTPWYLYGSSILASRKNQNLVWYAGSGYSNPAVYVSTNGGATFTPMNDGLPPTLVNEMVATPNEEFLFAATEAGPYVYVSAMNKWSPLTSNNVPVQFFTGVEYIRAKNLVRFSTMGRGVWDFTITSGSTLPMTVMQFDGEYKEGKTLLTWSTSSESNSSHFNVQRSFDGVHFSAIGKVTAAGNSNTLCKYAFTDALSFINQPLTEIFYRLQQVDITGDAKMSKVVRIRLNKNSLFTVLNNPVRNNIALQYQSSLAENITIRLVDASGKTVLTQQFNAVPGTNQFKLDAGRISNGVYIAELKNRAETLTLRLLKQ